MLPIPAPLSHQPSALNHAGPAHSVLRVLRFALKRRRRGKIACLPEPVREQINLMLRDGVTYAEIIARLGEVGRGLNKDNLSRWTKADHQDWLQGQLWADAAHRCPPVPTHEPAEQIARLLTEFGPEIVTQALLRDPSKYPPLLMALGKLTDAALSPARFQ